MGCSPSIRGSRESGDQDEHPARVPMDFPRVRPDAPHVRPDRRRADRAGAPPHRGGRRSVVRVRGGTAPSLARGAREPEPARRRYHTPRRARARAEAVGARPRGRALAVAAWPARPDRARARRAPDLLEDADSGLKVGGSRCGIVAFKGCAGGQERLGREQQFRQLGLYTASMLRTRSHASVCLTVPCTLPSTFQASLVLAYEHQNDEQSLSA